MIRYPVVGGMEGTDRATEAIGLEIGVAADVAAAAGKAAVEVSAASQTES